MEIIRQLLFCKLKFLPKDVKCRFFSRIASVSCFEGHNRIGRFSHIVGSVGKWTYFGDNCTFFGLIGRYCSVSSNVNVINGSHAFKDLYVSTCPLFYSVNTAFGRSFVQETKFDEYIYADSDRKYPVVVGNDVWLGMGVKIIQGVTIGDGAVCLACSVVTKDVPPYAIVGGVPAKVIGYRYSEEKIKKLLDLRWWDKDDEWILNNADKFSNIDLLI